MLDISVCLIFFNRPEKLKFVFEQIKRIKPTKLFLVQDGPRNSNYEEDTQNIHKCRKIVENIDWDCKVYKNYSDENLGCGLRPATGITWAFENTDKLIIIEDDCVPDISFFPFCKKLLIKYEKNNKIHLISGMNLLNSCDSNHSYLFSQVCTIGAWATWKRVWNQYDFSIKKFENKSNQKKLKENIKFKNVIKQKFWAWNLTREKYKNNEKINWWDYQFHFLLYYKNGLGIVPRVNLINNIGYGVDSTNVSKKEEGLHFNLEQYSIESKLKHPTEIKQNFEFDQKIYQLQKIKINKFKIFFSKIKRKIIRLLGGNK